MYLVPEVFSAGERLSGPQGQCYDIILFEAILGSFKLVECNVIHVM